MTLKRFFEITVGGPIFIFLEIAEALVKISKVIFWPLLIVIMVETAILLYMVITLQWRIFQ